MNLHKRNTYSVHNPVTYKINVELSATVHDNYCTLVKC